MSSPRWTGTTSRLLYATAGEDRIWRAEWSTIGGRRIHARLDLDAATKIARMDVPTEEQRERGINPRYAWAGEDPVGPLREPLPNGHRKAHWSDGVRAMWTALMFGGPERW